MYVVSDADTGYSDESMRFATKAEAKQYIDERPEMNFNVRYEH